jgi:hypothetical protein
MGKSLDFSSSFFLSLFPVLCVFVYWHTAEAHLIDAELCVHERTANDLIGPFLFPKADGGGRPVDIFAGYLWPIAARPSRHALSSNRWWTNNILYSL